MRLRLHLRAGMRLRLHLTWTVTGFPKSI
jgi:hypothetical protein